LHYGTKRVLGLFFGEFAFRRYDAAISTRPAKWLTAHKEQILKHEVTEPNPNPHAFNISQNIKSIPQIAKIIGMGFINAQFHNPATTPMGTSCSL
jgi:hypothetical protein